MNVLSFCSALCHSMSAPALLCDGHGCIREVNRAARRLLGERPEASVGADCADLLLLLNRADLSIALRSPERRVAPVHADVQVPVSAGVTRTCRLTLLPAPGEPPQATLVLFSEPEAPEHQTGPLLLVLDEANRPAWVSAAAREHFGPAVLSTSGSTQSLEPALPGLEPGEVPRIATELAALRAGVLPSVQFLTRTTGGDVVLWSCTAVAGPSAATLVAAVGQMQTSSTARIAPSGGGRESCVADAAWHPGRWWPPPGRIVVHRSLEPDCPVVTLTGECEAVSGHAARDLLAPAKVSWADLIVPADREALAGHLRAAREGRPFTAFYRIRTRDGLDRWVHEEGWPTHDGDGRPIAIEGIITDLSCLSAADERLRTDRDLYQSLFRAVPAGVIVEDADGRIFDVNEAACEILQIRRADMIGDEPHSPLWECVDEDETPVANERLPSVRARLRGESVRGVVLGVRRYSDRERRWLLLNSEPLFPAGGDAGGRPRSVVAFADITAQREALRALREAQELAQRIIDTSPNIVYIHDVREQRNVYANSETRRLLGYSPEELQELGPHLADVVFDARDLAEIRRHRERLATESDGAHAQFEHRMRRADGEWRVYQVKEVVFSRDPDGGIREVLGTAQDVTDRRRAEEAVRHANETAWALLNAHADMALLVDARGSILAANDAVARMMGTQSVAELLGRGIAHDDGEGGGYLHPGLLQEVVATGRPATYEGQREGRYLTYRLYPVIDDDGRVNRVAIFVEDMTDRKRAEDAARLAAVGQLAAGVAHDFNNLLAAMILAAEIATDLQTEEDSKRLADIVLRSAARGTEIGRNLIAFARPNEPTREPISLLTPLKNALATAARHLEKTGVRVVQQYQQAPHRVCGNSGQLEEVFLNLLVNACHAMPAGGTITIRASEQRREGRDVAAVSLTDTGTGIAPEHLPHIFEPFYTTKDRLGASETPGTGLGLSVAHGTIAAHGGSITVESRVGDGSTFTIELPLAPEDAVAPTDDETPPPTTEPAATAARILVAEDESDVAATLQRVLLHDGHTVVVATSVDRALTALEAEAFDLVITDLMMPGGSGRQVIARARTQSPAPAVLVITGIAAEGLADELHALGATAHLTKPFGAQALRAAVASLLKPAEE